MEALDVRSRERIEEARGKARPGSSAVRVVE